MRAFAQRIAAFRFHPITFPLFLLALCIAAYAPLITKLGFYWDDFPMSWIATTMGGDGLARYFSTNRPVWGLVYRVTTPLLGSQPLTWQVFALVMRWVTGLSLWVLLRQLWPAREEAKGREQFAAWAAALFCLYPGFSQQFIAFLYSHFYIILTAFLLSLALMVMALHQPRWFWPLTTASLLLSLLNLLSMEYFFLLDLLRPALIWIVLSDPSSSACVPERGKRLQRTLLLWLPYLSMFAGAMVWRSLLFGFHTYQPTLMSRLKSDPLAALGQLIPLVLHDVWLTSAGAIGKAFVPPDVLEVGARNLQRYWLLVATGALMAVFYLLFYRTETTHRASKPAGNLIRVWWNHYSWAWQPICLGVAALFIAGGPFWLTDLQIGLVFTNDRFTLPFMIGASLVTAGLLVLLPLPRGMKASLFGVLLGFAIGTQFHNATAYARDWSAQRAMFWQMTWRAPDLQPGTLLVTNELPVGHYTDNSLAAALNWTYDPNNRPEQMQFMLYYPTLRDWEPWMVNQQKGMPIERNYLATRFYGNSSQVIAMVYTPPGCLRVLDPEIDQFNWMIPEYMREILSLTTTEPILPAPAEGKPAPRPPAQVYGSEIPRGWCYFFEKAELARQLGDWQEVANLGDAAFAERDYPNDPLERFPFIEGYAHSGNWERAAELTRQSWAVSPVVMQPMLCKLWDRIGRETGSSGEQLAALEAVQGELECSQIDGQLVK